jgi:NADH dehydrogenase
MKIVTIFAGSGFVGRSVVRKLIKNNFRVKIITRNKEKSAFLKTYAGPDFLSLVNWDYQNFSELENIIKNSSFVINLAGILFENKKDDFDKVHHILPSEIAKICSHLNIEKFIHISALGVEKNKNSKYGVSKFSGEEAVVKNFPNAIILKPSIVFGEEDNFFNKFATMLKISPFLPLIGGGQTKFQPIYVEDLAEIILQSLLIKDLSLKSFEAVGNQIFTFKELLELIGSYLDKKIIFIPIPFFAAKIKANFLCLITKKIITSDQVELLKSDNIASENFEKNNYQKIFKISPKSVQEIVPNYIK